MSDEQDREGNQGSQTAPATDQAEQVELKRQLAQEAALRAKVHRHMGFTASILVLVAIGVALSRMEKTFGVSPWGALFEGIQLMPFVILILGTGLVLGLLPIFLGKRDRNKAGK